MLQPPAVFDGARFPRGFRGPQICYLVIPARSSTTAELVKLGSSSFYIEEQELDSSFRWN